VVSLSGRCSKAQSCETGPCVVGIEGADSKAVTTFSSTSNYVPLLSAVGCFQNITLTFQISKAASAAPLVVNFCQRQQTGFCLPKGRGGGDDWKNGEDFARICCSMHPKDRDLAAANLLGKSATSISRCKGYGASGYYDVYTCATLTTAEVITNSTYLTVANFAFVPPFGTDLSDNGQTEICLATLDDKRTPRPPTCLKIQASYPHPASGVSCFFSILSYTKTATAGTCPPSLTAPAHPSPAAQPNTPPPAALRSSATSNSQHAKRESKPYHHAPQLRKPWGTSGFPHRLNRLP
jgi:hypothetical protein